MMLDHRQYADWILSELEATPHDSLVSFEKIAGNRLLIGVRRGGHILKYRVLLFAVGAAGRSNPLERRVEITSTYASGLNKIQGHVDIVLGVERSERLLVAIDPRRLSYGGDTHNASTFVYLPSFQKLTDLGWFSMEVSSKLFPVEYQVYFAPSYLVEYLKQHDILHSSGLGQPPSVKIKENEIDRIDYYSVNGSTTQLSYDQQVELALKKMHVGRTGENLVLKSEVERLAKQGFVEAANKVEWTSQTKPYLGYDILSFDYSGKHEYIEVKSSVQDIKGFYFTANEMKVAGKLGESYRLICVSNALTLPSFSEFRNPIKAIKNGKLEVFQDTAYIRLCA